MADEGLREIQLRGKHLVSLFMLSAFLLVSTFLCGVLVGRGVRSQKEAAVTPGSAASTSAAAEDPTAPPVPLQPVAKTPVQAPAPAAATPPPVPEEELSYYSRLDGKPAAPGSAKPAARAAREGTSAKPVEPAPRQAAAPVATPPAPKTATPPARTGSPAPPPQKAVAPPAPKPTAAAPPRTAGAPAAKPAAEAAGGSDPPGPGYVVKIAAYRDKGQSSALAARLVAKGYAAYVVTVAGKGAPLYSVRVGKFKARADAEAAKRRLEKEEQFKPLITR